MANRMKEDEKNEKIIRGLLKLPPNRKCINCNSLGPQYVCTNFWTFVCTTCSGIHREFTHRVKSVSMAKFTSQEVSALQGGGNERAKEIYFKEWDSQRHSVPDSSNVERLRDFIKHVYVDRRYTGERSVDRPPRGDREDSNENRRLDAYRGDSRSPPYEDAYERRFNERSGPGGRNDDRNYRYNYDEKRSPGYEQENLRYGDYRKSPVHFEVVDDRLRNGNQNRRFEDRRLADGSSQPEGRSPNHQKGVDISSPPVVRPVRDILGEDIPPLRVGEPPKVNGGKSLDGSAHTQRTASSSSLGSTDGNSVELKPVSAGSLIDFNEDPEPPPPAAPHDPLSGPSPQQPTTTPASDGGNWASFDFSAQEKAPQPPSNATTLESALSQLLSAPAAPPVGNTSTLSVGGVESFLKGTNGGQWSTMQQSQPSFAGVDSRSTVQQFTPQVTGAPNNQPWNSLLTPNALGTLIAPLGQPAQAGRSPPQETSAGIAPQTLPSEAKPSGRKELPEDLFALTYAPTHVPVPGWQTSAPHGMGFGMQYPTTMLQPIPVLPQSSKSTNPFDLTNERTLGHAPTFPSMGSLQGALPNMGVPPPLLRSSSFGTPSPRWVHPHTPSYASAVSPVLFSGAYMVQQAPSSMPPLGHQGNAGFASDGSFFGTIGVGQQPVGRYSEPTTPNSFSSIGGNPFG
ncbi:NSP (nuclear shuttle protein)-interacting GTPase isoform X2 [Tasmannia lanceolata]|uniref:NSP (nuclear shuttle protein)-interacting GTPase isoform X2 n=1 Tax=Tasmannia lanceolata TaxID=3420 RepID=UPI004063CD84